MLFRATRGRRLRSPSRSQRRPRSFSHRSSTGARDHRSDIGDMEDWAAKHATKVRYRDAVVRSALALKLLCYTAVGLRSRGADDIASREARRRPELGLPLLLAAGRRNDRARALRARLRSRRRMRSSAGCCTRRTSPVPELCVLYDVFGEQPQPETEIDFASRGTAGRDPFASGMQRRISCSSISMARSSTPWLRRGASVASRIAPR